MRIGIDAHVLGKGIGGVERVVDQIVRRVPILLPDDAFFIFLNRKFAPAFPQLPNCTWVRLPFSDPLLQRTLLLPYFVRRLQLDLLHVQRVIPPLAGCPVIAHIHDILPLTRPHEHQGFRNALIRFLLPSTIRGATRILTVSDSARQEITSHFPGAEDKISAVPNGLDHRLFQPASPATDPPPVLARFGLAQGSYALYLGAITPRKNLEVLLEAYRVFAQKSGAGKLVIAGFFRTGAYAARLLHLVKRLDLGSQVCFTGPLSDEECVGLLQHARLFLAPSCGEGFDLPPLEAMACGIPVVASEIAVHRECLGDASVLFDPANAPALAAAMARVWFDEDLRANLIAAGRNAAARFSWDDAARAVAGSYGAIGKDSPGRR